MVAGLAEGARNEFNGCATQRQTVAFDCTRERRERKPAERFFAAWRSIPRNGTRGKNGPPPTQNDWGLLVALVFERAGVRASLWTLNGEAWLHGWLYFGATGVAFRGEITKVASWTESLRCI